MDLTALASERIMGELTKAFLKSSHPSVFFREMRRVYQPGRWFDGNVTPMSHMLRVLNGERYARIPA